VIRDIPEKISQKKKSDIQKKEKSFSVKKIVILKEIDMAIINTKIKILKIKIVYRRKLVIFQNLRNENVDEKSEFYIFIGEEILSVFRKRAQSSSINISLF
jgi:hypothetical protein